MREKVVEALKTIRPMLQRDGGDVRLVDVSDDGVVKVSMVGACGGCGAANFTLDLVISKQLKQMVPEIKKVVRV